MRGFSTLVNAVGGVIDDLILYKINNKFILIVNASNKEKDLDSLINYRKGEILIEDISNKTWSFAVGLGTNRNFSLLGISKDFKIGDQFSFFVTADIPVVIKFDDNWGDGHALAGIGFAYQNNYNDEGFNIINTLSYQMYDGTDGDWINHSSINYQWKIGSHSFISGGIMMGKYWSYDHFIHNYFLEDYVSPTISYDYRF